MTVKNAREHSRTLFLLSGQATLIFILGAGDGVQVRPTPVLAWAFLGYLLFYSASTPTPLNSLQRIVSQNGSFFSNCAFCTWQVRYLSGLEIGCR